MWLLKFHFCFSILCLITYTGTLKAFKEALVKNGYLQEKKKSISRILFFFVPILNILLATVPPICTMIKKDDWKELTK